MIIKSIQHSGWQYLFTVTCSPKTAQN
jgi:hypothetical protein